MTSWPVVFIGSFSLVLIIALAIFPANLSSPYSLMALASSSNLILESIEYAGSPLFISSLISSGWSSMNVMPLFSPLRWAIEMPRSMRMPSEFVTLVRDAALSISVKFVWTNHVRPSNSLNLSFATMSMLRSRSMQTVFELGDALRMASEWPPSPHVQSKYTPPLSGRRKAIASGSMTGV